MVFGFIAYLSLLEVPCQETWYMPPTPKRVKSKKYWDRYLVKKLSAESFNNWYLKEIPDTLPLIETLGDDCECPRFYNPICASNNRTFTNRCWMVCNNAFRKKKMKKVNEPILEMLYWGPCVPPFEPFSY